ncbi:MAG: hypothetical protein ACKO3W_06320 [bacterium]
MAEQLQPLPTRTARIEDRSDLRHRGFPSGPRLSLAACVTFVACVTIAALLGTTSVSAMGDDGKPAKKPRALAPTYDATKTPKAPTAAPSPTTPATPPAATPTDKPPAPSPTSPANVTPSPDKDAATSATEKNSTPTSAKSSAARADDAWEPRCTIAVGFVKTRPSDSPPLETEN